MATLKLSNIKKRYGDVQALKGVSLDVEGGEFISLVGPSGCGKSALLRIVAGLEKPDSGSIVLGEKDVTFISAADRNLEIVSDSQTLCSYRTAAQNIARPLQKRHLSLAQRLPLIGRIIPGTCDHLEAIRQKAHDVARLLEIDALLNRKPGQLSGGQCQQVALGRALVCEPEALLLDGPMSDIDAKQRAQTCAKITDIQRQCNAATIYTTQDQLEAMTGADRIAVMKDGRILQCASPEIVYEDPDDIHVAEFIGAPKINLLPAENNDGGLHILGKRLPIKLAAGAPQLLQIGVRPEWFSIVQSNKLLSGSIVHFDNLGGETYAHVAVDNHTGRVTVKVCPNQQHLIGLGAKVGLSFPMERALVFGPDGARLRKVEAMAQMISEVA